MRRNSLVYLAALLATFSIFFLACQNEQQITYARYFVNGKGLYEQHCQNCHAADGSGLVNLYPPLTDSTYLKENKRRLACIIKYGMEEKIVINGKPYEGQMPANTHLTAIDVTQIMVYVGNSFGNNRGGFDLKQVTENLKDCR